MRRFGPLSLWLFLPAFLCLLALSGCGKKQTADLGDEGDDESGPEKLTEMVVKDTTTLKGRIVYDGEPPPPESVVSQIEPNGDKTFCLQDPNSGRKQTWKVGPGNGVADVIIWVRPPQGVKFPAKQATHPPLEIHQPYCAFEPHASVLLPGQQLAIFNDAPVAHNAQYKGGDDNPGGNVPLPAKKPSTPPEKFTTTLEPDPKMPVTVKCSIHPWMLAYVWPSDTPYAVRTKEDGTFEIKDVPAGSQVRLVMWHEGPKFFYGGEEGKTITLTAKEHDLGEIKVKQK